MDSFKIIQDTRGYVLINENGDYRNHAHLKKRSTCEMLIRLISRRIIPKSKYLRWSCKRVTLDEEYKTAITRKQVKDRQKPVYYNKK